MSIKVTRKRTVKRPSNGIEPGKCRLEKQEKESVWRGENAQALRSSNEYVTSYGLPLAKHRLF
jgi:post-segregation antitoxin (ccd killing protein)